MVAGHEMMSLSAAAIGCLVAAGTDLRTFKVYNALTLPMLAGGLIASTLFGGWAGLATSGLGALVGFGLLAAFFAMGGVGAGDVKLFAALGAWLGPVLTLHVFLASAMLAGVYALALTIVADGLSTTMVDLLFLMDRMRRFDVRSGPAPAIAVEAARVDRRRRLVPFAATTCAGFFLVVLSRGGLAS